MIIIDKSSRVPVYEQVVSQMEAHIMLGEYKPEELLPSVRALSSMLGVNPNTLQKAYGLMEMRGLCVGAPGSGRYVAKNAKEILSKRAREQLKDFKEYGEKLLKAQITKKELYAAVDEAVLSYEKTGRQE